MFFHNHSWEEINFKNEETRYGTPYITVKYRCRTCDALGERTIACASTSIKEIKDEK